MNWDSLNVDENVNKTFILYNNYEDAHISKPAVMLVFCFVN